MSLLAKPHRGYPPHNEEAVNLELEGYLDFNEIAEPATPGVDVARIWAQDDQGFTTFAWKNDNGNTHEVGRDLFTIVRNVTGSPISKGAPVYISGSTGQVPQVGLADATSLSTLPAVGLADQDIANNSFGIIATKGVTSGFDTSAFLTGDVVYVGTTPGTLTATAPSNKQRIGVVVTSNAGNGVILVDLDTARGPFELSEDLTPQLGGDLDVNGHSIVGTDDVTIATTGDGDVILDFGGGVGELKLNTIGASAAPPQISSVGDSLLLFAGGATSDVVLGLSPTKVSVTKPIFILEQAAATASSAGFGALWVKDDAPNVLYFTDDAGTDWNLLDGGISNVVEDTTPQLGGDLDANGFDILDVVTLGVGTSSVDASSFLHVAGTGSSQIMVEGTSGFGSGIAFDNPVMTSPGDVKVRSFGGAIILDAGGGAIFVSDGNTNTNYLPVRIVESAAGSGGDAGVGEFWVKDDTPNTPWFTDDAGNDYPLNPVGLRRGFIVASEMFAYGGAANGNIASLSGARDLGPTGTEGSTFIIKLPKSWDESTTIRFRTWWGPSTGGAGNVVYRFLCDAKSTGDAYAAATTASSNITEAAPGVTDQIVTGAWCSAITPGGSPDDDHFLFCSVERQGSNGSDTYAGDMGVFLVEYEYTVNALRDD